MKYKLIPYGCYKILIDNLEEKIQVNVYIYNNSKNIIKSQIIDNYGMIRFINGPNKNIEIKIFDDNDLELKTIKIKLQHDKDLEQLFHLYLLSELFNKYKSILNPRNRFINNKIKFSIYGKTKNNFCALYGLNKKMIISSFQNSKLKRGKSALYIKCKTDQDKYYFCTIIGNNTGNFDTYFTFKNYKNGITINILKKLSNKLSFISEIKQGVFDSFGITTNTLKAKGLNIIKSGHFEIKEQNYNQFIDPPTKKYDIVVVIAFLGRYKMLSENIRTLNNQIQNVFKMGIILVGSNKQDQLFINKMKTIYNNIYGSIINNNPCGLKWQYAVFLSKFMDPKGIIILGSDDLLSLNYLDFMVKKLDDGFDLIGKKSWYIINNNDTNLYSLRYSKEFVKDKNILLGAGRVYSRKILDKCNFMIFDFLRNNCLDEYGCHVVNDLNGKIENDDQNETCI